MPPLNIRYAKELNGRAPKSDLMRLNMQQK